MIRFAVSVAASALLAATASAQGPGWAYRPVSAGFYGSSFGSSAFSPAFGLATGANPYLFGYDSGIGGPGYLYRGYPPFNGWSSGYHGSYSGTGVRATGGVLRRRR